MGRRKSSSRTQTDCNASRNTRTCTTSRTRRGSQKISVRAVRELPGYDRSREPPSRTPAARERKSANARFFFFFALPNPLTSRSNAPSVQHRRYCSVLMLVRASFACEIAFSREIPRARLDNRINFQRFSEARTDRARIKTALMISVFLYLINFCLNRPRARAPFENSAIPVAKIPCRKLGVRIQR